MDDSLDDILHETEAIERNYKNDSSMTIGISQLSDFFKRIEKDQTSNLNGQFLLAQQGIDSAKTERVIKEMEESLRSEQSEPNLMQSKEAIQSTKIPRTALELFERSTRNELDDEWDSITQDLMNMAENTIPNYKIPSSHFFPTQGSLYSSYSEEAVIFARNVQSTPLPTAPEILERSIQSLDEYSKLHPLSGNNQVKLDYFIALRYILQNVIDDLSDLSLKTHLMIIGSLDFLHHQFMTINFPSKTELTESDIDLYVSKNFPNAKAPWANIWIAIRSGNFEVVKQICRNYPETNEFLEHFENFVLEGNAPTSSAKNCSVLNDTLQSTPEEQFKLQCYSFAVGFELQHPQTSAMDTIEDYLFCVLSPLRFGCDSGSLVDIQNIIREEASKHFSQGNSRFIYSMILLICLQFQESVDQLFSSRIFPIETLHICMILKSLNLWEGDELLSMIINEFVNLLPNSMYLEAIDYLSFVNDENIFISYLNTLDPKKQQFVDINVHGQKSAINMIQNYILKNQISYSSLKLLIICSDFEKAFNMFLNIESDFTLLTFEEFVNSISLCTTLILHLLNEQNIEKIKMIGINISLYVLNRADQINQNDRQILKENMNEFLLQFDESSNYDEFVVAKLTNIRILLNVLAVLNLFDIGNNIEAMKKVKNLSKVFPMSLDEVDNAVNWVMTNLDVSTLIGTVSLRIIEYLSLNLKENLSEIKAMLKFTSRISLTDNINRKLMEIHDRLNAYL